jgi:hypothetical protein
MGMNRNDLIKVLDEVISPGQKTLGDIADHVLANLPCDLPKCIPAKFSPAITDWHRGYNKAIDHMMIDHAILHNKQSNVDVHEHPELLEGKG